MAEQIQDDTKFTAVRLPKQFKPIHYDLSVKPDLHAFTFQGTVKIHYTYDEPSKEVTVHANDITILDGAAQTTDHQQSALLQKVIYGVTSETATLCFDKSLQPSGIIVLRYIGCLNDKLKGFYRTAVKITDPNDSKKELTVYAATTKFEPTDARRFLPCCDEPALKASFSLQLTYNQYSEIKENNVRIPNVAISNTPILSQTVNQDGTVDTEFEKSPIMSTYLLALVVGPFEKIEGSDGKRPICVYTSPGKKQFGEFSLYVASKALPFYENYFNVPYPLKKLDMIAIPDFASGAMENWGLITYRESCLLVDPENTATNVKQFVAICVTHELAHQWFGNLVTMEWWTELWLNEGFASFMEYLCTDHIFPDYDIWSQFVTNSHCLAIQLDALHNSHPVEVVVNHPSEIGEIFDEISYEKGSCVIRMIYNYVGDEDFRKGMNDYMTRFAYRNVTTVDLWDSLERASGKPVKNIMSGWTLQKGFPWLNVSFQELETGRRNLKLEQSKFTSDGILLPDEKEVMWMIPVDVVYEENPLKSQSLGLMSERQASISIDNKAGWVKLNSGAVNFYHVAYPTEMSAKFRPAIQNQTMRPMDRLDLHQGSFALLKAGKKTLHDHLDLMDAYHNETEYTVWCSIDSCIGYLNLLFSGTKRQEKLQKFGRDLYSEIFKKITWTARSGEKHSDGLTRSLIITRLIILGETAVIEEALKRFDAHFKGISLIPADLRNAVYRAAASHGDNPTFENLFSLYRSSTLAEEKNRISRALGTTTDEERLKRVVKLIFSDEIRNQDKFLNLMMIAGSKPEVAWQAFKDNKDFLRSIYGTRISRLVRSVTRNFATDEKAKEIESFFKQNPFPGAERSVLQSIEDIRLNSSLLARSISDSQESS